MNTHLARQSLTIEFPSLPANEAGQEAAALRTFLRGQDGSGHLEISKAKPSLDTQDLGTILTILLNAPAVEALARGIEALLQGIGDYLRARGHALSITGNGWRLVIPKGAKLQELSGVLKQLNEHLSVAGAANVALSLPNDPPPPALPEPERAE